MTTPEPNTDETVRISVNENESSTEEKKEEKPKTPQVTTALEKEDFDEVRFTLCVAVL